MSTFFEHVVEQYPPELKKKKYRYWRQMAQANADFRESRPPCRVNGIKDFSDELRAFEQWMREQWGLDVSMGQDGPSPYYTVVDEQKYLLFELKYAGCDNG